MAVRKTGMDRIEDIEKKNTAARQTEKRNRGKGKRKGT